MLHILLIIGKAAGFLLLGAMGLLLFIILAVLLSPLRYKGRGSYYGKPEGKMRISWFFHLFSIRISYREELQMVVRILFFPVFRKTMGKKQAEENVRQGFEEAQTGLEELIEAGLDEEPIVSAQELGGRDQENPAESETGEQYLAAEEERPAKEQTKERQDAKERRPKEKPQAEEEDAPEPADGSFFNRIRLSVLRSLKRLKLAALNIQNNVRRAEELRGTVQAFCQDEENKKTARLMGRQVKKVLRHLRPKRLRGKLTFGFDDPYITGQILTGAALLYPFYGNSFQICPFFDQSILEGELSIKGRIRLGTILMAGLRVLLNKNFRIQLKRLLNRGGMR